MDHRTDAIDRRDATDRSGPTDPGPTNPSLARCADVIPVKRIVAVLWSQTKKTSCDAAYRTMQREWGDFDIAGRNIPFEVTDYYHAEMGPNLQRTLFSFDSLMPPESLVAAKLKCNQIESELAINGNRTINLDVGYLDHNKIVLASVKFAGQKIHLGSGVYADLIARFRHGRYEPFEWTFPDFRDGRYDEELAAMRDKYLKQLRPIQA
jgi:hypothetical protein